MVDWTKIVTDVLLTVVIAIVAEKVLGFHHYAVVPLAIGAGVAFYYRQKRRGM
jgi:hypothetical protein